MVKNPEDAVGWDARCCGKGCGEVHVIWLDGGHEEGEIITYAHIGKPGACGDLTDHRLEGRLDGIDHPKAKAVMG